MSTAVQSLTLTSRFVCLHVSCCPEPYPDVTFILHIRRRTLYYTYNVIIPCIMLSSLSLMGFWVPPEGGEKVALGMTVLLSFSVFMLLIAENMPATSFYIPLIGMLTLLITENMRLVEDVPCINDPNGGTRICLPTPSWDII